MSNLPVPAVNPHLPLRRPWWKRWRVPFVLLVLVLAAVGWWYWTKSQEEHQLTAVCALWDQEGRWRWNDWLTDRPVLPDAENGAPIIDQMLKLIPGSLETDLSMLLLNDVSFSPNHLLHVEQTKELRDRLQKCGPALKLFPEYLKRKPSVWGIPPNLSPISMPMPYLQHSRLLLNRLGEQMEIELDEGKTAQAQQTLLMGLQLTRNMNEQLTLIGRLVQLAMLNRDCENIQRWIALSEADDPLLSALQTALSAYDEQRSWQKAIFIEVGSFNQTVLDLKSSKLNLASLLAFTGSGNTWWDRTWDELIGIIQKQRLTSPAQHAECLEIYLKLYRQAKEPWSVQKNHWEEMATSLKQTRAQTNLPSLKHLLLPAMDKVGQAEMKLAAKLRVTQVALAAERYRRVHQRWPQTQQELLKGFLPSIQLDPFDDQPIRIKPVEDGLVIYSIGKNNVDDGGDVVETRERSSVNDVGIKLWNVNKRRLAALPLSKEYLEKKAEEQRSQGGDEQK